LPIGWTYGPEKLGSLGPLNLVEIDACTHRGENRAVKFGGLHTAALLICWERSSDHSTPASVSCNKFLIDGVAAETGARDVIAPVNQVAKTRGAAGLRFRKKTSSHEQM